MRTLLTGRVLVCTSSVLAYWGRVGHPPDPPVRAIVNNEVRAQWVPWILKHTGRLPQCG